MEVEEGTALVPDTVRSIFFPFSYVLFVSNLYAFKGKSRLLGAQETVVEEIWFKRYTEESVEGEG